MSAESRVHRFDRLVGGAAIVVAPILFAFAEIANPATGDTPAEELSSGAPHLGLWLAVIYAGIASSILFVVGTLALVGILHRRGAVLVRVAAAFTVLGACLSGLVLAGLQTALHGMAAPGVDHAAMIKFLNTESQDAAVLPFVAGHYLFALGVILLGVAIWRSGFGSRWAGVAVALGVVVDVVFGILGLDQSRTGDIVISAVSDGLMVVGFAAIGLRVMFPLPGREAAARERLLGGAASRA